MRKIRALGYNLKTSGIISFEIKNLKWFSSKALKDFLLLPNDEQTLKKISEKEGFKDFLKEKKIKISRLKKIYR